MTVYTKRPRFGSQRPADRIIRTQRQLENQRRRILRNSVLSLPGETGDYASTPDSAALSITGDIDLRVKLSMVDWAGGLTSVLSKYLATGDQRSYQMRVTGAGGLNIAWSPDGTAGAEISKISSANTGFAANSTHWIRATLDVDNGAVGNDAKFYTSEDGVTWTQLGTTQTTAATTSINDGTSVVAVSGINNGTAQTLAGKVYRAIILNGIDGTVVFDADFTQQVPGTTSFAENSSNVATVTINQNGDPQAEIVNQS